MDSITYIYLESLSVFRSGHKLLSNTPSNLDTGQRPLNRPTTGYCNTALTLPPACCLFTYPGTSPLHGRSSSERWQTLTATPCKQEVVPPRSGAALVHSCCYLPFQWEIYVFILLQNTQKSLFTSSQLLCNMLHHPSLCWIWPTNSKQSFVCSYQIFLWCAVFRSIRLSYQILTLFLLLCSGCCQIN